MGSNRSDWRVSTVLLASRVEAPEIYFRKRDIRRLRVFLPFRQVWKPFFQIVIGKERSIVEMLL